MELREKIARTFGREEGESDYSFDISWANYREEWLERADAILALPEIAEALRLNAEVLVRPIPSIEPDWPLEARLFNDLPNVQMVSREEFEKKFPNA